MPFTSDPRVLETGVRRADAIGGTAMRDAVDMGQAYLSEHGTRDRKVLVIVTDGIDNASVVTAEDVVRGAEQRDTVMFAVGLFGANEKNGPGRHELDQLTDKTGGVAYIRAASTRLDPSRGDRQIRNQYTIGYESTNKALDGSYPHDSRDGDGDLAG